MALTFNVRHLEKKNLHLEGELDPAELDVDGVDELVRLSSPLSYDLTAERIEEAVLVRGRLEVTLACECSRCLRPFEQPLILPDWACHLAFGGEEAVPIHNDCVDLTPYLREDILLSFPQHPVCGQECHGLPEVAVAHPPKAGGATAVDNESSVWAELNKLKF